jgi:hypothetical protein
MRLGATIPTIMAKPKPRQTQEVVQAQQRQFAAVCTHTGRPEFDSVLRVAEGDERWYRMVARAGRRQGSGQQLPFGEFLGCVDGRLRRVDPRCVDGGAGYAHKVALSCFRTATRYQSAEAQDELSAHARPQRCVRNWKRLND